jgi:hypothetical protein
MTDIEAKALALVNEIQDERGQDFRYRSLGRLGDSKSEALCRAIEQHEAFKQEVSKAMTYTICAECNGKGVAETIAGWGRPCDACHGEGRIANPMDVDALRAALDARGLEIREKNDD